MSPPSPSPLGEDERSRLRAQLAGEQHRLRGQLAGLERTFEDLVAAADVEPADDEHDPDGTTAYERAQISSLARVTRARLAEVDAALDAAVHDPAFGECRTCGTPIGLERLAAVPGTMRCIRCAAS